MDLVDISAAIDLIDDRALFMKGIDVIYQNPRTWQKNIENIMKMWNNLKNQ